MHIPLKPRGFTPYRFRVHTQDLVHGDRALGGFTLIELLVVIAIIGILSSVVLASLVVARYKSVDAQIKSNLHTLQTQIELYYDNNGNSYGSAVGQQSSPATTISGSNAFNNDPQIKNALSGAISAGGPSCWSIGQSGASYMVAIPLKADSANWWCLDSNGRAKTVPASTFSSTCDQTLGRKGGGTSAAACP
jgi:prepilin-type N-terminal cleavage/methylation domain-containing protein